MGIKWDAIMTNEKKQFEKMTETEKFIYSAQPIRFNTPRLAAAVSSSIIVG